jgi:hypothetical protein
MLQLYSVTRRLQSGFRKRTSFISSQHVLRSTAVGSNALVSDECWIGRGENQYGCALSQSPTALWYELAVEESYLESPLWGNLRWGQRNLGCGWRNLMSSSSRVGCGEKERKFRQMNILNWRTSLLFVSYRTIKRGGPPDISSTDCGDYPWPEGVSQ